MIQETFVTDPMISDASHCDDVGISRCRGITWYFCNFPRNLHSIVPIRVSRGIGCVPSAVGCRARQAHWPVTEFLNAHHIALDSDTSRGQYYWRIEGSFPSIETKV